MNTPARQANIKFTYQDYALLSGDKRYELMDGDFYMTPSPFTIHQIISAKLHFELTEYVQNKGLGIVLAAPMDVVLSDESVVQPDVFFISHEQKNIIKPENIRGAPDLVVEILSPSTAERDLVVKKRLYARYAVKEYWIVDPEKKTIEVMTWSERGFQTVQVYPQGSRLSSPLLDGFAMEVKLG